MDFLAHLNPPQREAVEHTGGPLLILAGAGSGKTRVITYRITHLIRNCRVFPGAILAVTFTNKAADEMRERVGKLLGESDRMRLPRVSTFHSFCVRLLRRDGDLLAGLRPGFTRDFTIYDEDDQLALIKQVYRHAGLDEKFMQYRAALARISHAKNRGETPQDFYKRTTDPKASRLAVIWDQYEGLLRQANALDFDDLLNEAVRLLRHASGARAAWQRNLEHLMVDEYQDTNRSQYDLMRLLTGPERNVCVVGDEDQSIYGWRGADINNILDFEKDYPGARVIRLEQNYRSTKNILAAAGAVVANNKQRKGKTLWTRAEAGSLISLYEAMDAESEALWIAERIERLFSGDKGTRVAVLYRTNFQSRQIEEALRRYGRPYIVVGGFSFYQRAEIKDVFAYLKAARAPQDSISLLRIINTPARGIGKTTVAEIEQYALQNGLGIWAAIGRMLEEKRFGPRAGAALEAFRKLIEELGEAAKTESVLDLLKLIVERSGYERMLESDGTPQAETRLENLSELLNAAADAVERGEDAGEFLDHAALVSDADSIDEAASVSLLTMHNAKGLEFPAVFMAGMEEGLFPHSRSMSSEDQLEEERRLCYVGMTRARARLFLSWARTRRRFGGGPEEPTTPSRFLGEVPPEFLDQPVEDPLAAEQVDLYAESWEVRRAARKNTYTGKTYNSLENIAQFFEERGIRPPAILNRPESAGAARVPVARPPAPAKKKRTLVGTSVNHPRYGQGQVLRQEGEGEEAKLTVSFPGYGLKKLVAKYAGLKVQG